jgi:hypothetical protein
MPRPQKKAARLYTRHQGSPDRYYADLRPLGGKREPLIRRGETLATDDPEIARSLLVAPKDRPAGFVYALLGTFLLTGGRRAEVFGASWARSASSAGGVTFRPNRWRRLKTSTSRRNVPSGHSSERSWSRKARSAGAKVQSTRISSSKRARAPAC